MELVFGCSRSLEQDEAYLSKEVWVWYWYAPGLLFVLLFFFLLPYPMGIFLCCPYLYI